MLGGSAGAWLKARYSDLASPRRVPGGLVCRAVLVGPAPLEAPSRHGLSQAVVGVACCQLPCALGSVGISAQGWP